MSASGRLYENECDGERNGQGKIVNFGEGDVHLTPGRILCWAWYSTISAPSADWVGRSSDDVAPEPRISVMSEPRAAPGRDNPGCDFSGVIIAL